MASVTANKDNFNDISNPEQLKIIRCNSWLSNLLRWTPTSVFDLELAERKVLSYLKKPFRGYYVNIGSGWGLENNQVWTLEMGPEQRDKEAIPLVLLHGFASAVGLWALNLDSIANTNRKIYAIDILGFGRSSRPYFDRSEGAELEVVQSIERWRQCVGLDQKFILLGHSFGGYLALSYALQYPEKVAHLILADPWGMPSQQQAHQSRTHQYQIPIWVRMIGTLMFQSFNPLAGLRAAGPWGPKLIEALRPDLRKKFERYTGPEEATSILNYIYHCNAQSNPSGEIAFKSISLPLGWARYPMINRVNSLHPDTALTFIYGSRSWIDRQPGFQIKYLLGDTHRVDVHVIHGSGHHVYADKPDEFNDIVTKVCNATDHYMQQATNNNGVERSSDEHLAIENETLVTLTSEAQLID